MMHNCLTACSALLYRNCVSSQGLHDDPIAFARTALCLLALSWPPGHQIIRHKKYVPLPICLPCLTSPTCTRLHAEVWMVCRKRNGIDARSSLAIKVAEADLYVANVGEKLVVKLGPRVDMPQEFVPQESEGWQVAATGKDFCVWEKSQ